MNPRLKKMGALRRKRVIRRLERASDHPLLQPETRQRVDRLLLELKAVHKALAYHIWNDRSGTWRTGLDVYLQWHPFRCDCGTVGTVLYEGGYGVWPYPIDVEGFRLRLTEDGRAICRGCSTAPEDARIGKGRAT